MLAIRPEQMKVFEDVAMRRFEDEMVEHVKSNAIRARLCKVLGDEQLRVAIRQTITRAGKFGFTNRGPIRLYIELAFLFGSDFDTDPQYPAIGKILKTDGEQMERAEQIHQWVLDYQKKVYGPEAQNVPKALQALSDFAQKKVPFTANNLVADMLDEMTQAFPQKAAHVGEAALKALIQEGRTEARNHRLPIRGEALLATLKYGFGHGCTDDPLYPWILQTLKDEKITDPPARAERLEKKAMTWLETVLARHREGAKT